MKSSVGLLLFLVSSWVAAESDSDAARDAESVEFSPEIEKLLNETSDLEEYVETSRCINARLIRNSRILDDRHVIFEMPGKKYLLVQFTHRCQRLRRNSALIYETRGGGQLCRLDQIRAGNINERPGPPCSIPGFSEVTAEQVSLLKEILKNSERRPKIEKDPDPVSAPGSEDDTAG